MNDIISVIVPVYNVEKYVAACIKSILSQTYQNFEVLLVDDGSSDTSGNICDEFAKIDSRIRVFHKHNGGPSSARNYGLRYARGGYITFVDSDDSILPNFLEQLYNILNESHAFMACSNNPSYDALSLIHI